MDELLTQLNEPITQIIVLGVVLVFYALCYSVRLAGGKRRTKKQKVKWSWDRFWNDLHFRIMIGYALVAAVVAVDMAQWLLPLLGWSLSPETAAMLDANLIIALPFIAGLNELVNGVKLLYKVWKYKENLEALNMAEQNFDASKVKLGIIADDIISLATTILNSINTQQENPEVVAGEVLSKKETKQLAEMGAIPYYKLDVSTPQLTYQNLLGKSFNEGWGYQCVAGFKEFMFSMFGQYVAAGGAAANYASEPAISNVCKLGFTWHNGSAGLQDGDWGIWTNGLYGHVAMYYQGKWLGQNQGAADGNVGNAFNLMGLPMTGFAGYFRPNSYAKATNVKSVPVEKKEEPKQSTTFKVGDKVIPIRKVDYDGRNLRQYDDSYTITQINGNRAVLSARGQVWAAMNVKDIEKV